jgi:hypothetical protein
MTARAAAKRHYTDAQVTVNPIESIEMDNRENVATLNAFAKLNNIIQKTYQCVTDKKKKKKLLGKSSKGQPQAKQQDLHTYKYSDYPESGISPEQHAPPAAAGQPAAPEAVAAAAGGVPLLAPAPAGLIPPAALPGPLPFAAAAALPTNFVPFNLPAGWQDLHPLPPDDPDDSFNDEFFNSNDASNVSNSDSDTATALGEDSLQVESEVAEDHDTTHLEADPDPHDLQPFDPSSSLPFQGFTSPPLCVRFSCSLQILGEEEEEEEREEAVGFQLRGQRGDNLGSGRTGSGLTETHLLDLARASIDEQAVYYDALLSEVDHHTQEADCTLQTLQGATPHQHF